MFHDIEDRVMEAPSILCGGSSCRLIFASSVRVMKPRSNIRHLHWLQILLVILLTGPASTNQTSEAPLPPTSTVEAPQTSVQYLLNVTVEVTRLKNNETEIIEALREVFEMDLDRCLSSDYQTTTTTPVSPQNTSPSTSNNTDVTTVFQNDTTTITTTTTTPTTPPPNTTTTTATTTTTPNTPPPNTTATTTPTTPITTTTTTPTTPITTTTTTTTTPNTTTTTATTTTPTSTTTTAATTTTTTTTPNTTTPTSTTTTAATTTTPTSTTITAATTVTMLTSNNTTTATIDQSTTTTLGKSNSSTPSPNTVPETSTGNGGVSKTKPHPNPPGQGKSKRAARAVSDNVAQTRGINLFQELVISCATSTSTQNTECSMTLQLNQGVSACCVLRTLCASNNSSPYIKVVGKTARLDRQQCNSSIEDSCAFIGPADTPCQSEENLFVELDKQCELQPTTTPSPNVTTIRPNTTTTTPANETAPQNTTVTATTNQSASASAESQAYGLLELTRNVSKLNSSQIDQLVSQLESLLSGPNVSVVLGNISIHIVSNLLGASNETLASSSKRIIRIVDTVGLKLVLNNNTENLLAPAMALSVKPVDGSNFQTTVFSISDPSSVQVSGDARLRRESVKTGSSIPQGSIQLPQSLTNGLNPEVQKLASRVQFNFYQKSTVFQDNSLGRNKLNSGIISASVANLTIKNLTDKVVINLRNMYPIPANYQAVCAFWDFALNNQSGGWSTDGCSVKNSTDNETICACNHLTSFAILLDLSRQPVTSRVQATILTFISYIGCGISSIFLSFTLLTYLLFEKLRRDIPSKILIHLCFALLLLNLVFLVDSWLALYTDNSGLCISTAWFLHYFLLVVFTWMGLGAVHMYLALVKVFNSYVPRYILKFSLVGWGIPMIVVTTVIAIKKKNYGLVSYGKFTDGTSDTFCWLTDDTVFYGAVVAYFCVIFLFNFIMFIVVLVQVCRIKRQNPQNLQHRTTLQDVRSVAGITILLGLTWGFAFFAWGPLNLPFMYLFSIFNSLQGFFIFLFHCLAKENVRRQWRVYLCCGRMRLAENSQWSRTATQKTVKKLSTSHSSQSGSSSSSTSFLASDSSAPANGIGNPLGERVITADEDGHTDVILNELNSQSINQQAPS